MNTKIGMEAIDMRELKMLPNGRWIDMDSVTSVRCSSWEIDSRKYGTPYRPFVNVVIGGFQHNVLFDMQSEAQEFCDKFVADINASRRHQASEAYVDSEELHRPLTCVNDALMHSGSDKYIGGILRSFGQSKDFHKRFVEEYESYLKANPYRPTKISETTSLPVTCSVGFGEPESPAEKPLPATATTSSVDIWDRPYKPL